MTDTSDLGDRMKKYENVSRIYLTPRMPTIIRVDGKSFSKYCRGYEKPWDPHIISAMTSAASLLLDEIQGAKVAYCQSDEISVLINDYELFTTNAWFDKNVQKMCSVSASIATAAFNADMQSSKSAYFDARCFVIPREDVVNYMYWRQVDAIRNSVSGLAQANFSHKQLHKKNSKQMKEMLLTEKNIDWNNCSTRQKRGWCVLKETVEITPGNFRTKIAEDKNIPLFSEDRDYIGKHLEQIEE